MTIPDYIREDYMTMLINAAACGGNGRGSEEQLEMVIHELDRRIDKILTRFLSDGDTADERKQCCVAILELGLQLAKGEIRL